MMNRFFTLLLATSCLTAVGQVPDYVPTDGLVIWSPLEGTSGEEVSGASLVQGRFGESNSAYSFDGDDWLELEISEIPVGNSPRSISFWYNQSSVNDNSNGASTAFFYGTISTSMRWASLIWPDTPTLIGESNDACFGCSGSTTVELISTPLNEWHHVVYTFDGAILSCFINGQLGYTSQKTYSTTETKLTLGKSEDAHQEGEYFSGSLDDIGIWDRALSSEEIASLFNASGPLEGCTNESACNFDLEAVVDDGSCTLADCTDPQACNFNSEAACDDGNCVYAPTIDLGEDIVSCEEWVVLEAQDGQFFHWSTGESDSIIEVSQTGFYAVEASSQIGEPNVISGHTFIGRLGQSDYYISEASISWEDARMQSESLGGHLAVITSPEENELVWQGVYGNGLNPGGTNNYQAWIGLYQDFESPDYAEPNGGWRWVTDEAVSYLNWAANRPANLDQGYFVHMTDANGNCPEGDIVCGTWDDSGISANLQSAFYVLEVESPYGSCTSSDSIFVEFDHGSCFCGPGTIWDAEMQMCIGDGSGDINLDGCVQLNDLLDLLSAYGNCAAEESPWQCGDPLEYQGYDYETVQIGGQCWFAENLRAESYRNGDMIPSGLTDEHWGQAVSGAKSIYGEGTSQCYYGSCDEVENLFLYGRLYNNYSVQDGRGLCPTGWNVPSDEDWGQMELWLGMSEQDVLEEGWRTYSEDFELKSDSIWPIGAQGSNNVGFNGRPAGARSYDGHFYNGGVSTTYWTNSSLRIVRSLGLGNHGIERGVGEIWQSGFSIRCIKDAELCTASSYFS